MVRKLVIAAALLFVLSPASFARTVKTVKIEKAGLSLDEGDRNPPDMCKPFMPTVDQVKRFFSKAYPVPVATRIKDRYTPCYAEGRLEFSDGNSARWTIYSSGTAILEFDLGGSATVFYKDRKWHDPTACTYGNDVPSVC